MASQNHYRQICDGTFSPWKCFLPADLRWHLLTLKMFFTGRFAMAPSHLENIFYRQVCDGIFSPWNCFTCRFAMAPSHLQNFSPAVLGWRLLTCNIFYQQICDGTFSPAIFFSGKSFTWPVPTQNAVNSHRNVAGTHKSPHRSPPQML